MPEVMRQIAMAIAKTPSALDDTENWIASWKDFIIALGAKPPVESEKDEISAQEDWAEDVVKKFAAKGIFKHHMSKAMTEMEGVQP
jgi:hypothetical protein